MTKELKLIMLGSTAVGKTTLMTRWVDERLDKWTVPNVGCGFRTVDVASPSGETHTVNLWDTAGQEQFKSLTKSYCRGADAAIIVFSVVERSTFDDLPGWLDFLSNDGRNVPFVIFANKTDLYDERVVTFDEALEFAKTLKAACFETSAFSGANVDVGFEAAIALACERVNQGESNDIPLVTENSPVQIRTPAPDGPPKGNCCL